MNLYRFTYTWKGKQYREVLEAESKSKAVVAFFKEGSGTVQKLRITKL